MYVGKYLWSIVFTYIFLRKIQPTPFLKYSSDIKDLVAVKTLKTYFVHRIFPETTIYRKKFHEKLWTES